MASKTEIANICLAHLAVGKELSNLDTDTSSEAKTIRRFYELALNATIRDFPWPNTTKIAALALVESSPNDEWDYSYRYPTDCLNIRRILSGARNDTRQSRVSYKLASDSSGTLVYADEESAEIEYTANSIDPQFYSPDMVIAFSFYLAYLTAPKLTGGDQFKLGQRALQSYQVEITRAVSRAFNEEQPDQEPDSQFIRDRE
jgi:hypothetical protein